ncbi:hypothetical protein AHAS_Ahas13G0269900 [Arachis hypogaea]
MDMLTKAHSKWILGWQQVAGKIGMQRCAASGQWLNERITLSRYARGSRDHFLLCSKLMGHAKGVCTVVGRVPQVGCNNCI